MKLEAKLGKPEKAEAEALILFLFEDELSRQAKNLDTALGGLIQTFQKTKEFKGESGEVFLFQTYGKIPAKRVLLTGLGKKNEFEQDSLRKAASFASIYSKAQKIESITFSIPETKLSTIQSAQTIVEGSLLGLYQYLEFKTEELDKIRKIKEIILLTEKNPEKAKEGLEKGKILAENTNLARDITNAPSNEMNPTGMETKAREIAKEHGLKMKVLDKNALKKEGLNAFLAVSLGSAQEPKLIILEHNPENRKTVVLIGKSVTFDAGGLDLKPERGMRDMKDDKGGGASVLGIMAAASKLKLPLHLVALIPATENMPGCAAYKPGDIIKSHSGKTIEVINTDAEGRMTLADALSYANKYNPKLIIDLATLTGACVVALGFYASGMLGNNPQFLKKMKEAGEKTNERVWELPLWEEYREEMKSDLADIKNLGDGGAGTITAAAFLEKFVSGKTPWIHLDIAGPAWAEKPKAYNPKGATGYGVRLVTQFLSDF